MKTLGFVLLVIGIITVAYAGLSFAITQKMVDTASFGLTPDFVNTDNWTPIVGIAMLVGGIVFIVPEKRKLF